MTKKNKGSTKSNNWKRTFFFSLIGFILVLGGCLIYSTNAVATQGEEISQKQDHLRELEQQIETLEQEVQATASLKYIERQAKERLGMVPLDQQIIYITPGHFASAQP